MYAKMEEDYGLAKRAMSIYDRATQVVQDDDKFEVRIHGDLSYIYTHHIHLDVHRLHRESYGELWSTSHPSHI